jgi:hypothetical protein
MKSFDKQLSMSRNSLYSCRALWAATALFQPAWAADTDTNTAAAAAVVPPGSGDMAAVPMTTIIAGSNVTYYNGSYQILPLIPSGLVPTLYPNDLTITPHDQIRAELNSAHDTENVTSIYGQYQMTIGKLGIIAGVRIENTDADYNGFSENTDANGNPLVMPTNTAHHYTNAFPEAQARYEIDHDTLLRASFSSAIARSGFNEINPSAQINPANNTVTVGNPDLKPTTANAELFYERNGLNLRIGVMYVSADLFAISGSPTQPDVYSDSRLTVDFGSSFDITDKISFYFDAKNMNNAPLKFYEGTPDRTIQREFYRPTYLAGLNFKY